MDFCNVCNVVMLVITIYYKAILCNVCNFVTLFNFETFVQCL